MADIQSPGDEFAAAIRGNQLVPMEVVERIDELTARPTRPGDYEGENQTFVALARAMADSPGTILQTLVDLTLEQMRVGSVGVGALSEDGAAFRWPAIAGRWKSHLGSSVPRDFSPYGDVLDRGKPLLFVHPERRYAYLASFPPAMAELLIVPFHIRGRMAGVFWAVLHDESRDFDRGPFDGEDLRQLIGLGRFAAAAHETSTLFEGRDRRQSKSREAPLTYERRANGQASFDAGSASRRAALNLLEDAVHDRETTDRANQQLRENEARLAMELAATRELQSSSSLPVDATDPNALYLKLVDAAVVIMQSDMGSLQLLDEGENALRMKAWRGFDGTFRPTVELNRPDARTSYSAARQAGQRVVVPDIEKWEFLAGTPELEDHRRMGIRAVQSTPLTSRNGRLIGMISTHWRTPHVPSQSALRSLDLIARQAADLIERNTAEEAISRLAAIVASSDDAIIGKDLNGIVTSWNDGAQRLFGYSAEEMIGQSVTRLIPAIRANEEPSILERIRNGERVTHYETVRQRKDGSHIYLSITVSPVRDANGRIIGAAKIARDVSARKDAEEALIEADRHKNEFLAMLAHELRGPLAPVRNGLQIIRVRSKDAEAVASATGMMERQLTQMARLIDDLIDISRISRGKLELRREPTEVTSAVRSVAEAAYPMYVGKRLELTVTLSPQPIYVDADPTRLAQIVGNLLNNAFKFTEMGGRIGLTVEREGDRALIRVRDTGIGIAAESHSRIFDMFSQVDSSLERSTGGLGIGLSLVKNVVEMHGGEVTVHSAGLGRGSEFVVRLPIILEPSVRRAPEPFVAPRLKTPCRILVVDDNLDSADSLAMLLEFGGHEVHAAHDGLEAVEEAANFNPDVVLLDLGLPKLNGYDAARRIRKLPGGNRVRLVALSGWGQDEDRRRAKEAGFDAHLVKPVALDVLNRVLAEVCSRSTGPDP